LPWLAEASSISIALQSPLILAEVFLRLRLHRPKEWFLYPFFDRLTSAASEVTVRVKFDHRLAVIFFSCLVKEQVLQQEIVEASGVYLKTLSCNKHFVPDLSELEVPLEAIANLQSTGDYRPNSATGLILVLE
jgi:hypothetical protein